MRITLTLALALLGACGDQWHCDGATEYLGEVVRCEAGGICIRKGDEAVCKRECSPVDVCADGEEGERYFTILLRDGSNVCYCDVPGSH